MIRQILLAVLMLLAPLAAQSAEIEGHKFEDKITVDGKELLLNGVGLRTVVRYGLTFKVYVMGMYLEKRSSDAKAIMESGGVVHLKSYYLREVTKKQQKKPFRDAIRNNCYADCSDSKKKIFKIINAVKRTKEGGAFDFTMYPDKVRFFMDGANAKSEVTVEGKTFSQDMLAIWLGPNPPNEDLKAGILGEGMDWKKSAPSEGKKEAKQEATKKE